MKKIVVAALLSGAFQAGPVSAAVVANAFTSFNGTQGAGGFLWGQGPAGSNQVLLFGSTPNCFIAGSICLQAAPDFNVPGVTKSTTPSFQYNSVIVPSDRLLLHPDASGQDLYVFYRPRTPGDYIVQGTFNVQDLSPTGVAVSFISPTGTTSLGTIDAGNPLGSFTTRVTLGNFDSVGFSFNAAGNYSNDATGFNLIISSVPEPVSWTTMIGGIGVVGASLRRRRAYRRTAVSFA